MIDITPIGDFEVSLAAMLDAVDKLRALEAPKEADGIKGLIKWADEVKKALSLMPDLPDAEPLTQFAEEVERAVSGLEDKAGGGGPREKAHPNDDGILPADPGFWAEIETDATGGAYTFKEKKRENATTWSDLAGGRTGTCYESNVVAGIAVGKIIQIREEYDTTGTLRHVFDYEPGILPGTADKQMVAWDQTTDKAWELILPDEVWLDVVGGELVHIGPGEQAKEITSIHWLDGIRLDAKGHVKEVRTMEGGWIPL